MLVDSVPRPRSRARRARPSRRAGDAVRARGTQQLAPGRGPRRAARARPARAAGTVRLGMGRVRSGKTTATRGAGHAPRHAARRAAPRTSSASGGPSTGAPSTPRTAPASSGSPGSSVRRHHHRVVGHPGHHPVASVGEPHLFHGAARRRAPRQADHRRRRGVDGRPQGGVRRRQRRVGHVSTRRLRIDGPPLAPSAVAAPVPGPSPSSVPTARATTIAAPAEAASPDPRRRAGSPVTAVRTSTHSATVGCHRRRGRRRPERGLVGPWPRRPRLRGTARTSHATDSTTARAMSPMSWSSDSPTRPPGPCRATTAPGRRRTTASAVTPRAPGGLDRARSTSECRRRSRPGGPTSRRATPPPTGLPRAAIPPQRPARHDHGIGHAAPTRSTTGTDTLAVVPHETIGHASPTHPRRAPRRPGHPPRSRRGCRRAARARPPARADNPPTTESDRRARATGRRATRRRRRAPAGAARGSLRGHRRRHRRHHRCPRCHHRRPRAITDALTVTHGATRRRGHPEETRGRRQRDVGGHLAGEPPDDDVARSEQPARRAEPVGLVTLEPRHLGRHRARVEHDAGAPPHRRRAVRPERRGQGARLGAGPPVGPQQRRPERCAVRGDGDERLPRATAKPTASIAPHPSECSVPVPRPVPRPVLSPARACCATATTEGHHDPRVLLGPVVLAVVGLERAPARRAGPAHPRRRPW